MSDAIIFSGLYSLDFSSIRENVVRIPEVMEALRSAQASWDLNSSESFDFCSFLTSGDANFMGDMRLKGIVSSVVQIGLYQRYVKKNPAPKYVVGLGTGDSPLKWLEQKCSIEEFVAQSDAVKGVGAQIEDLPVLGVPQLAGAGLAHFSCLDLEGDKVTCVVDKVMNLSDVLQALLDEYSVGRFINLGPGQGLVTRNDLSVEFERAQIADVIDLDPLLTWFWPSVKAHQHSA